LSQVSEFVNGFIKRKGQIIFFSSITQKLLALVTSIIIIRLLPKSEYGFIVYAMTILAFVRPLGGLGLQHSLLRYGAIQNSFSERLNLFYYSLKSGITYTIPIILGFIIVTPFFCTNIPESGVYLRIMSVGILFTFLFNLYKVYYRILNKNELFAYALIYFSVFNLLFVVIGAYFFSGIGFAIAATVSPLITFLFLCKKRIFKYSKALKNKLSSIKIERKEILLYGFHVGIGTIASQMVLLTDNLVIGNLIDDPEQLAIYRTGSIIPLNLLFIPSMFFQADFTKIASEYKNSSFLKSYYSSYFKVFLVVCIIMVLPLYFLSDYLIPLLFGAKYMGSAVILQILCLGVVGAFLLRIPFGNMLGAVGKSNWNAYNGYLMLVVNLILTYYLTIKFGIIGAAYASAAALWLTGMIGALMFVFYTRTLKEQT